MKPANFYFLGKSIIVLFILLICCEGLQKLTREQKTAVLKAKLQLDEELKQKIKGSILKSEICFWKNNCDIS